MSKSTNKYLLKTKIMICFEIILLVLTFYFLLLLRNVLVGIFYLMFIINLSLWLILIILTVNLYNKAKIKGKNV